MAIVFAKQKKNQKILIAAAAAVLLLSALIAWWLFLKKSSPAVPTITAPLTVKRIEINFAALAKMKDFYTFVDIIPLQEETEEEGELGEGADLTGLVIGRSNPFLPY
jgi:flagellar basal body-associated protein FliL